MEIATLTPEYIDLELDDSLQQIMYVRRNDRSFLKDCDSTFFTTHILQCPRCIGRRDALKKGYGAMFFQSNICKIIWNLPLRQRIFFSSPETVYEPYHISSWKKE